LDDPVTTSVTTSEKKVVTSFEGVLSRLKEAAGVKSDTALAKVLGVKQSSISSAKNRRQIPTHWVFQISENFLYSADWLFFGIPPKKLRTDSAAEQEYKSEEMSQKGASAQIYNDQRASKSETSLNVSELLLKTAKILDSETVYAHALSSNISAFHDSIQLKEEINHIHEKYKEVNEKMERFSEELQNLRNENKKLRDENKELWEKIGVDPNWKGDKDWF